MIKIKDIKINIDNDNKNHIISKLANILNIKKEDIIDYKTNKKSIDARNKNNILYVYEILASIKDEEIVLNKNLKNVSKYLEEKYIFNITGTKKLKSRPIIVGSGPCGLFAGYILALNGYNPIIIERGEKIGDRVKSVEKFWNDGTLNEESNIQFGEGGAGTFSDGKLNTLSKNENHRQEFVFDTFVKHGAPIEILYENKPHIGTDKLRTVVKNIREEIISYGGDFLYNSKLTDINIKDNKIESIVINDKEQLSCEALFLAIGHSARDTYKMLYNKGLNMMSKPFAVGLRIIHNSDDINKAMYGESYKKFKPASYKLTYKAKNNKGVYSFCMCPGGYVVNASSKDGYTCVNGMSDYKRDSKSSNSGIVVTVNEKDYGTNLFDGMNFQDTLEKNAYNIAKGKIPIQKYIDYKNKEASSSFGSIIPEIKGLYSFSDLNNIFSEDINNTLKEAIDYFGNKIKGFDNPDSILAGVESRTSSPLKIIRDENLESNIKGIYPCGEGAGYAGGITTAAMDGLKVAEEFAKKYNPS